MIRSVSSAQAPKLQVVNGKIAATTQVASAPARLGDSFKAASGTDTRTDEQKLDDFIKDTAASNPQIGEDLKQARLNLGEHMEAAAILFVLSAAVGAGSYALITALKDRKNAFAEAASMSPDPLKRKLVARDEKVSLGTVMRLAADPDLSVRYAVAVRFKNNQSDFDKAVVEILANDPNPMIRALVATSDKLSAKTASKLANAETERSPQVRAAALQNKNLSKTEREFLERLDAESGGIYATLKRILSAPEGEAANRQKIGFLRSNPGLGLSRETMEALAKSKDAGVREALARRPDLADDLIKQMYEHREYSFGDKFKNFFRKLMGKEPVMPSGDVTYETNRIVLMSLANNPNASVSMLTHMVEHAKKNSSSNNLKSSIDPKIDTALGIPAQDIDQDQYNTDIVARAIVGNPRTNDAMRQLANAAAYPYRYNEKTALEAHLALNNANDLYLKGKYAESADAYKKAIATTFHDSEQAYFELGLALMATGDAKSAGLAMVQALNINPRYTAAAVALDSINRPGGRD